MKIYFLIVCILTLMITNAFAQHNVKGVIIDESENRLPGVEISEQGTSNKSVSDKDGQFQISTIKDNCKLIISFVGMRAKTIEVNKDTILNIKIYPYGWGVKHYWNTFGTTFDPFNSAVGFVFSNGLNEEYLLDFEQISAKLLYRINGQTDFNKNNAFGAKLTYPNLFRLFSYSSESYTYFSPSLEYSQINYKSKDFFHRDLNLSTRFKVKIIQGRCLFKMGIQSLNYNKNIGAELGYENNLSFNVYYGILGGYYFDYFTYNGYIESFILKRIISLRLDYKRIDKYDILNLGVNFTLNYTTIRE